MQNEQNRRGRRYHRGHDRWRHSPARIMAERRMVNSIVNEQLHREDEAARNH